MNFTFYTIVSGGWWIFCRDKTHIICLGKYPVGIISNEFLIHIKTRVDDKPKWITLDRQSSTLENAQIFLKAAYYDMAVKYRFFIDLNDSSLNSFLADIN